MKGSARVAVVCVLLALTVAPASAAGEALADKEGWWNRIGRTAPTTLPETVPEDAIGIAARVGEPEKVAALGIVLDAAKGSTVETFTLTLKEAEGTGAQQNSDAAVLIACPVIDFFAGDANGAWEDAPAADCEAAAAEGERNPDGTWVFDLAPIANAWLDPFGTIAANGILFQPGDGTFQVSLTGMEDAVFDVALAPPQEDSDPFDEVTTTVPGGFTGGAPSSPDVEVDPPPDVAGPETGGGTQVAAPEGDGAGEDEGSGAEVAAPAASRSGDVAGNLPGGIVLLVLLLVGGAALVGIGLGPLGRQRSSSARRSGGVSRALEARTTSGAGT